MKHTLAAVLLAVAFAACDSGENDTLEARDDTAQTSAGQAVTISVLANDRGDGRSINSYALESDNGGAVTKPSANELRYTPRAGFTGTDTFGYSITDDAGRFDRATVTVTVR